MKRSTLAAAAAVLCVWSALAHPVYPDRPLRMIVASAPGGGPDIASRLIGAQLSRQIGQQVVVENRLGGSGVIGMDALARATPDGYTFGQANFTTINTNRILMAKLPYNAEKAFQPLIFAYMSNNMLAVNNALPVTSVGELVAYAKRNPGKLLYGAGAPGSSLHFCGALFNIMAGLQITPVFYKASSLAIPDAVSGQIQLIYDNINSIVQHTRAGRLRALGVTRLERTPAFPDIPSIAESGVPGFEVQPWAGFVSPSGVPKNVAATLAAELNKALSNSEVRTRLSEMGLEPKGGTPELFAEHLKREFAKWSEVAKRANIRLD
jgi:tripartite-type tricarboxylate transporter receptor subunit TctC